MKKRLIIFLIFVLIFSTIPVFAINTNENSEPNTKTTETQTDIESNTTMESSPQPENSTQDSSSTEELQQKENEDIEEKLIEDEDSDIQGESSADEYLPYTLEPCTEDPITAVERSLMQPESNKPNKSMLRANGSLTPGGTVHYTSKEIDEASFFSAGGLTGYCGRIGYPRASGRNATVSVIPNTSKAAKVVYYWCYKKGWEEKALGEDKGERQNSLNGMYRLVFIERMIQYAYQGQTAINYMDNYYSSDSINLIKEKANEANDVVVPDSFTLYLLTDSKDDIQNKILVWGYNPTGNLTISKSISNTEFVNEINRSFTFTVTVAGANGTYSGVTFSNGSATVALNGNTSITITGLPANAAYSVSETVPSSWKLEGSTGTSGSIVSGSTVTATFVNGYYNDIKILKKSTDPPVTDNNSLYNTQGTVFELYRSKADAINGTSKVATFTIGNNNESNVVNIKSGTYYLIESTAGPGYLIPDSLKRSSGGVQIVCKGNATINII